MKEITIKSFNGETFPFLLPEPGSRQSFFAFSLHKAGSTLLFNLLREAMVYAGVPIVDIPSAAFENGQSEFLLDDSINKAFKPNGYAYLGWRLFPHTTHFNHKEINNILLVRDPRDCLISLYFSMKNSHVLPENGPVRDQLNFLRKQAQNMKFDSWVFQKASFQGCEYDSFVQIYIDQFRRYLEFLPKYSTRIYRYEDVIFQKHHWLEDMLGYLEIEMPETEIYRIAEEFDIRPDSEKTDNHVRQVAPGNHKKHMLPETINKLNEIFHDILTKYRYYDIDSFGTQLCFSSSILKNFDRLNKKPMKEYAEEDDEFLYVEKLIPSIHPIFVDVGAEKGSFSKFCLNNGMSGVAFEPLPDHFTALSKMAEDQNLEVYPWAIDFEDRESVFHIPVDEQGYTMSYFHSLQKITNDHRVHHEVELQVQCRSLTSLYKEGCIPSEIGILKIDTEGNDLRVLKGLGDLRPQIVICELFTDGLYKGWEDAHPLKLVEYLKDLGYMEFISFSRCGDRTECKTNPDSYSLKEWGNLLFFHKNVQDICKNITHKFHSRPDSSSLEEEVRMLRTVCDERLALIERLHNEAAELRKMLDQLKKKTSLKGLS